jgi:hypothetical protein|nr:MAG TPA: hypothetical protein [Caudoviricetes sp.]
MSAPARIVDKLRNYEYEKDGYADAVGDIYALIHHIAGLEEEIDDLRVEAREKSAWEGRYYALLEECEASRPREIDGGEGSRGAADGVIAIDAGGKAWRTCYPGCWFPLRLDTDAEMTELPEENGPYMLVYIPEGES